MIFILIYITNSEAVKNILPVSMKGMTTRKSCYIVFNGCDADRASRHAFFFFIKRKKKLSQEYQQIIFELEGK